ncbi:MAG: hypothetical protein R2724_22025 [Bryobacterales bacterium]
MHTVARWILRSIPFLSFLAFVAPAGWSFPPAQTYLTDSAVRLGVTIPSLGLDNARLVVVGPTRTRLGDTYDPGDGRLKINTEVLSMVLTGDSAAGVVILRAHPTSPAVSSKDRRSRLPGTRVVRHPVRACIPNQLTKSWMFSDPEMLRCA